MFTLEIKRKRSRERGDGTARVVRSRPSSLQEIAHEIAKIKGIPVHIIGPTKDAVSVGIHSWFCAIQRPWISCIFKVLLLVLLYNLPQNLSKDTWSSYTVLQHQRQFVFLKLKEINASLIVFIKVLNETKLLSPCIRRYISMQLYKIKLYWSYNIAF